MNITKMFNQSASKHESSMVMGYTLLSIDPKRGTPSTSLGPKMGIEPTSLSRTLSKLEEKKLITRTPNPMDKRGVIIKLTEEGLILRDISKSQVLYFYSELEKHITVEESETFYKVLDKINELTNQLTIQNKNFAQHEKTH
ncbi:MAG: MarR family transcriptional regulator [Flavobacteriaceae bacterium]|nr:MAG: MarR family transcriptional regulator [Flavobacteriaceae bacterium]